MISYNFETLLNGLVANLLSRRTETQAVTRVMTYLKDILLPSQEKFQSSGEFYVYRTSKEQDYSSIFKWHLNAQTQCSCEANIKVYKSKFILLPQFVYMIANNRCIKCSHNQ
jgi:hypothetical protein